MSTARALRDLDTALARNVALEVEAAEWKIKAQQAQAEVADLKEQLKFAIGLHTDLMKMIDAK